MKVNNRFDRTPVEVTEAVYDGFSYDYNDGELERLRRDVDRLKEIVARLVQSAAKENIDDLRFLLDQSYWEEVK